MTKGFTHESTKNKTKEWYTPEWIFKALNLTFDLDPCAPKGGLPWIPAKRFVSLPNNGLLVPWRGLVWMNPPYGQDTPQWLRKFVQHKDGGVALVFARTDTAWFHHYAIACDAILFLNQRVRFKKPDETSAGTPGSGSMLLACGKTCVVALEKMADKHGWFVRTSS